MRSLGKLNQTSLSINESSLLMLHSSSDIFPRYVAQDCCPNCFTRRTSQNLDSFLSLTSGMQFFRKNSSVPPSHYIGIQSLLTLPNTICIEKPFLTTVYKTRPPLLHPPFLYPVSFLFLMHLPLLTSYTSGSFLSSFTTVRSMRSEI